MKYWSLLLIAIGICISTHSYAGWSHGGDIKWENLGNDSFKFIVTIYRDCNGLTAVTAPLRITSACSGRSAVRVTRNETGDITNTCSTAVSSCNRSKATYNHGIEESQIIYVTSLASFRKNGCCKITMSWSFNNRSSAITTGGANNAMYIETSMNLCGSMKTVDWVRTPRMNACVGKDFSTSSFTIKTDLGSDSIHYSWAEPLQSSTLETVWASAYSYDEPVYFLGFPKTTKKAPQGLHLDEHTGRVFFRPMKEEITILKVKAEIYRDGIWQGTVSRDQVLFVEKCSNENPVLSSFSNSMWDHRYDLGTREYEKELCPGDSISFTVEAYDDDSLDDVEITVEHQIPGLRAVIDNSNSGSIKAKIRVEWRTHDSMAQQAPYVLTIRAKDKNCPIVGEDLKRYRVFLKPKPNLRIKPSDEGCGVLQLTTTERDSSPFYYAQYRFKSRGVRRKKRKSSRISDSVWFQFAQPGLQRFTIESYGPNFCRYQYEDSLVVPDNFPRFNEPYDTLIGCIRDSILHIPKLLNVRGPSSFTWNYDGDTLGRDSSISIQFHDSVYEIRGKMIHQGCEIEKRISVAPHPSPRIVVPKVLYACEQDSIHQVLSVLPGAFRDSILEIHWTDSLMNPIKSDSEWVYTQQPGRYQVVLKTHINCWIHDTLSIRQVNTNFDILGDSSSCEGSKLALRTAFLPKGNFKWYVRGLHRDMNQVVSNTDKLLFYPEKGDTVNVVYSKSMQNATCSNARLIPIKIEPLPTFQINVPDSMCQGDTVLLTSKYPSTWKLPYETVFGDSVWYVAKDAKPVPLSYQTSISATTPFGCSKDSQFHIYYHPPTLSRFSLPDSAIKNTTFYPTSASTLGRELTYLWKVGTPAFLTYTDYEPNITIDSQGVFDISLLTTNTETGCSDFTMQTIKVLDPKSTPENPIAGPWSIYPNPAKNTLYLYRKQSDQAEWSLSTLKGQIVKQGNTTSSFTSIAVDDLAEGMYVLRLVDGEHSQVQIFSITK